MVKTVSPAVSIFALAFLVSNLAAQSGTSVPGITRRLSISAAGGEADAASGELGPAIDYEGRRISFVSSASDLVPGDGNGVKDIFVRDRDADGDGVFDEPDAMSTTRASVSTNGVEGNADSFFTRISADGGRHVVFTSYASNLVRNDTNVNGDVFVHDLETGKTVRVSVSTAGGQGDSLSQGPRISGDGRKVAFTSLSKNLVPGDTNGLRDIFVRDRDTDEDGIFDEPGAVSTVRVSVSSTGRQADGPSVYPVISADGCFVAFTSFATNLVPGDTGRSDVFVHDLMTHRTVRVSVSSAGGEGNRHSGDFGPYISTTGRFVNFVSLASNLVPGDLNGVQDAFVHDRDTDEDGIFDEPGEIATIRVSVASNGNEANAQSTHTDVSPEGGFATFTTAASNLVPDDDNGAPDVFIHELATGETRRVSVSSTGAESSVGAFDDFHSVSDEGRFVTFPSAAPDLVSRDRNGVLDVFVHEAWPRKCSGRAATLVGTPGADVISGTSDPDVISGMGGNDGLEGLGGADVICGGSGDDTLIGGGGGDQLEGGAGQDLLKGGAGIDVLSGGDGNDNLQGEAGGDTLQGGAGDDKLYGGTEVDFCQGGAHVSGDQAFGCESTTGVP